MVREAPQPLSAKDEAEKFISDLRIPLAAPIRRLLLDRLASLIVRLRLEK